MKILQVTPYFPPAFAFGGPVRVAYEISQELVERGNEVTVYTTDAENFDHRFYLPYLCFNNGIQIYYMKNLTMYSVKKLKLFLTPQIIPQIQKEGRKFDVFHLHEYRTFQNVVVATYAKRHGIPYILQAHGSLSRIVKNQRLKQVFDFSFGQKVLKNAARVIALNQNERLAYMHLGVPEEKIEVIPNGIRFSENCDLSDRGSFKRTNGISADERIVLYIGRLHQSKGLDLLVKAFGKVSKKLGDVRLVLIGPDDGDLNRLRSLISTLQIDDKVLLTGFVQARTKTMALIDSYVFVTPYFYGFPVTFLESCVAGVPIITTSYGDSLSWINEIVGYVTLPTESDLANALYKMLSDNKLHSYFSANCQNLVKAKFSIQAIANKLESIYRQVIED